MTTYDLGKVVGENGQDGDDGNGIVSIEKTGTSGLVDTYTITYTDGDTDTFTVTNGSDASVTIVTSWNSTTSDSKVPSEKLAKTSLDGKLDNALSSTAVSIASNDDILITDYSDSNKIKRVANILATQVKDSNAHSNIGSSANATQGTINSNIDTALSNKVSKSQTSGLLKNDGTVDTTSYSTFSGSYNDLSNKPTIPSASSTTPSADTTSGSYGSGTSYARSNHSHPKSSLYAESSHTHTKSQITDFPSLSTVATSGSYADLSNKPSIPSSSSDLSDGSSLVKTSSTTGLLKNDGSVDTNSYLTTSSASSTYQTKLVSGTSIKTINNESLLGSGNITIQGGGGSVDIVTAWESTPSDSKVASEKLTKDTLDLKSDSTHTHGNLSSDGKISTTSSATMLYFTGVGASANTLYKSNKLSSDVIIDGTAHSNLGTSANASQSTINSAIDTLIGQAITYINQ